MRDAKLEPFSTVLRRSTRASHSADVERVVHLTKYEVQAQKLTEFSDDDDLALKKSEREKEEDRKKLVEFGGTIGASLLIILLPIVVFGIHVFCNQTQCSFTKLPDLKTFSNISTYFNMKASLVYFAFLLILSLLTVLPFGGRKINGLPNKYEKLLYTANAPFGFIVLLLIAATLQYFGIGVVKFVNTHYFQFLLPAFVFGVFLSIYCYYKSFYVPLSALTTNSSLYHKKLYNFFMGREINPRLFGVLDLKIFSYRATVFGAVSVFTF